MYLFVCEETERIKLMAALTHTHTHTHTHRLRNTTTTQCFPLSRWHYSSPLYLLSFSILPPPNNTFHLRVWLKRLGWYLWGVGRKLSGLEYVFSQVRKDFFLFSSVYIYGIGSQYSIVVAKKKNERDDFGGEFVHVSQFRGEEMIGAVYCKLKSSYIHRNSSIWENLYLVSIVKN